MRIGSLFAGIGGFDLGLERAGMVSAWQVEIAAKCRQVLTTHWPGVERLEDVRNVGRRNLEPVDLICGGFPCQDVSVAGRRAGLAGERSGLWFEFSRIIDELEPRWAVIENVPGLLSSNGGRDFGLILQWLVKRGYGVAWRILDAQYYGLAQRRRRVFIVASLGDGRAAQVLFEREGLRWDSPPGREAGKRVAGTLAAGAHPSGFNGRDAERGNVVVQQITITKSSVGEGGPDDNSARGGHIISIRNSGRDSDMRPGRTGTTVQNDTMFALQSAQQHAVMAPEVANTPGAHHPRNDLDSSGAYIASVAPTLSKESYSPAKSSSGQMVDFCIGDSARVRRLTPTECERLQGFPDGWTAGHSDSARYKMLGNAVAVPVAEWIGRRIMEAV